MLLLLLCLPLVSGTKDLSKRVVYAINCGGPQHVGEGGIVYKADQPMENTVDSDFGERYYFVNAYDNDRVLYQTERYSLDSFSYRFPAKEGQFVLILKFSEVYFTESGQKIFNVNLNGIPVIKNLDVFKESQYIGAAYDKYVEFSISKGQIATSGQKAAIGSFIEVEFAKGLADNPKINAIAILTGKEAGLPPPPPPFQIDDHENNRRDNGDDDEEIDKWQHMEEVRRQPEPDASDNLEVASGPRMSNPYDHQSDFMGIVLVGLLVLTIPVVFFLRRL